MIAFIEHLKMIHAHPSLPNSMHGYIYAQLYTYSYIIEGSLEVKLPTIWTNGKAEVGRVREEKSRREKSQKKEDAGARNGRKVAKHCIFRLI